jgi:hypothetical protein
MDQINIKGQHINNLLVISVVNTKVSQKLEKINSNYNLNLNIHKLNITHHPKIQDHLIQVAIMKLEEVLIAKTKPQPLLSGLSYETNKEDFE